MKRFVFVFLFLISIDLSAQNNTSVEEQTYDTDSIINIYINEINQDSIRNTIQLLQNYTTRFMLEPNRKNIALMLKEKFISMGYLNTVLDSFSTITDFNYPPFNIQDTTWQYNVIATMEGTQYSDSVCIACGHYDSFSDSILFGQAPGADDDASGVSAAFEIARIFKKMNYQPRLTIKFIAFGAEELMLFSDESGASYYAKKAYANNEKIKFVANNDMISYNRSPDNWKANFNCYKGMNWTKDFAINICMKYTSITPKVYITNEFGDSYPFWKQGFQTIYFEEREFNPYYHTTFDVVDSASMDYCAEMTKITMAMLISGTLFPTGIDDNNLSVTLNVKFYPNPVVGEIVVDYAGMDEAKMLLYNIVGECVFQKELNNGINNIDISYLPKGIYMIKISAAKGSILHKLIKE